MLKDKVRMDAYKQAIEKAAQGKVVIDVGAGTGVLSIMAANFGAKFVHAVEGSAIATEAEKTISLN